MPLNYEIKCIIWNFNWTEYSVNFISEALLRVAVLSGISQCLNLEPEPEITSQTMVPEPSQKTD